MSLPLFGDAHKKSWLGFFLGPTLLAVGHELNRERTRRPVAAGCPIREQQ